jgi:hypothetical protein
MSRHDREPVAYTCPDIDKLIAIAEELRKDNESLRDWGREEAEKVDELEARIQALEEQVSDLHEQLTAAQAALENTQ